MQCIHTEISKHFRNLYKNSSLRKETLSGFYRHFCVTEIGEEISAESNMTFFNWCLQKHSLQDCF